MPSFVNQTHFNAYLAGMLDGDGSIYVRAKPNDSYRFGYQIAPTIAFFQSATNILFVELCKSIRGGSMRIRKDGICEYTLSRKEEIKNFLEKVSPYLVLKQDQAKLMLTILEKKESVKTKKDFQNLLNLIDTFRDLNYSKRRKKRILTP